ncbi:hypothetical protein EG329_009444 [Mollisiaceae sp. DMI_Dod_QoI]|nr:hypothetical protein EG329_009444 [Helotiales sp. DMI_Dod_QoI]
MDEPELPPDFNSSDFEVSEPEQPQKKRKLGHGIAQAIIRNQAVDRRESKKSLRTLQFAHGAPGTRTNHETVIVSWDAFCQTISHDPATCPTGDDIFRYLDTIVRNTKTKIAGKPAASLSVIRAIWARLIKLLKFRHEKLLEVYTPSHVTRIEIHLDQLVNQGKLIRGTWFKKQWVSFMVLLEMAKRWFTFALTNGTRSWDITLLKVTSVVLQSALSSTSGDVTRSQLYEGLECLCWKDITLCLADASNRSKPSVQNLRGTFLLRFTKGAKRTMNDDKTIHCDPLDNTSQSPACAIKLLLAFALRLGRVHGSTLVECLRHTARRADGTVQWTDPDAPVFGQMKGLSPFIFHQKPAGQEQVRYSLQEMALKAGILEQRIDTRALRRGALRDQAYIKKFISGVATRTTAMIAGHTNASYSKGTTREYVGDLEDSMYNLRAEQERIDRKAPVFAQEGPSAEWVQERIKSWEIDQFMKAQNMDIKDSKARKRAGLLIKKQKNEQWRTEAKDQPLTGSATPIEPLRQRTANETNSQAGKMSKKSHQKPTPKEETQKYFSEPSTSAATVPAQQDKIALDDMLDPQLAEYDRVQKELQEAALQSLADAVFVHSGDTDVNSNDDAALPSDPAAEIDSVDSALLDTHTSAEYAPVSSSAFLEPTQEVQLSEITTMNGDDFVHFFSKINIFQIQKQFARDDEAALAQSVPCGNSRDKPTSFLYYCEKGCGKGLWNREAVIDHEVNCTEEQLCPLENVCHSTVLFTTKKLLKQHLRRQHHVTNGDMKNYVPDGRKGNSNIKGKKRKPKGWLLGPDNKEDEDMQEDEIDD